MDDKMEPPAPDTPRTSSGFRLELDAMEKVSEAIHALDDAGRFRVLMGVADYYRLSFPYGRR